MSEKAPEQQYAARLRHSESITNDVSFSGETHAGHNARQGCDGSASENHSFPADLPNFDRYGMYCLKMCSISVVRFEESRRIRLRSMQADISGFVQMPMSCAAWHNSKKRLECQKA